MYMSIENKKAQCESGELSFIWGRMKTIAQETVSESASLRAALKRWRRKSV